MEKSHTVRIISPKHRKSQFGSFRSSNPISLPSLKNPARQQVDTLLHSEREKIHQKLKLNYFTNDISYLKDKNSSDASIKLPLNFLPTDILEIFNKVYSSTESELDFLTLNKKPERKSSPKTLIEKLLTPKKKTPPEPTKTFIIGAPTSRQEAINLRSWYDLMAQKYFTKFKEILQGKGNLNHDKVLKAWKAVYRTVLAEIERQTSVHCIERGKLLNEVVEGYEQLYEFSYSKFLLENQRLSEVYAKEISEVRLESSKKLAHFQVKIESLEKERFELRHNNGQCIVKIRELERIIDDFRRNEKTNLRGPKIGTQKYLSTSFEESPSLKENKDAVLSVSDTLVSDINKKMTKLANIKKKIVEATAELKSLETEVSDRKVALSSLNFEMELRQNLVRPIAKYTPKILINLSTTKKKSEIEPNLVTEDDSDNCITFFQSLIEKPKERLINKCKVSQDHIFQSLSVIYQRAIIQIEIFNEIFDFKYLVYKQFVKLENRKKSEKVLKNFISGCLKLSDFRRVSVFLQFLNLGALINKKNFSTKTLQVYLSGYLYMDTLPIGLLIQKDTTSPTQFYPLTRALAAFKELSLIFPQKQRFSIESFLNSSSIQDPKQINPQGLIELELFLEKLSEDFEFLIDDIRENCFNLFETVSSRMAVGTDYFRMLLHSICPGKMQEVEEMVEKECLEGNVEVRVQEAVDVACKFHLLMTEDVAEYLGNLVNVSESFARNLLMSQYPSPVPRLYENILENIEKVQVRFALVWWKIFNNNQ